MKYGKFIIEKGEYEIISDLLSKVDSNDPVRKAGYVALRAELENADIRNAEDIPDDVVRLLEQIVNDELFMKSLKDKKRIYGELSRKKLIRFHTIHMALTSLSYNIR